MKRVAVLLSGGVDSSVALARLKAQGDVELTAFYLKIWLEDDVAFLGECPWEEDLRIVREICRQLDVPLKIQPLQREYREEIVEYSLQELREGRTPSGDVLCNRLIKFGAFWEKIASDFDVVASGHYARTRRIGEGIILLKGVDPVKDQSYFLCRMSQEQLARSLFPIGELPKAQVREEAKALGLVNAERPDSQGICFLGKIPYRDFVRHHLGEAPGPIIDVDTGRKLGEHRGLWFHTIGQRRGLGLAGGPWYVVDKVAGERVLLVTHQERLEFRRRRILRLGDINWLCRKPEDGNYDIRLRHGERLWPGKIRLLENKQVEVELEEGDPGIAAGQFAVIYEGSECLGGGPVD